MNRLIKLFGFIVAVHEASLYTLLQILSASLFEKISLAQALTAITAKSGSKLPSYQLDIFGFLT